jgi:acyl dehydratase
MTSGVVFTYNTGIEDDEIVEVRKWIDVPLRIRQFNNEVTEDAIRHYAFGLGDDNPLWCNLEYGRNSPYGSVVAPPSFLYAIWSPGIGPGFPGLQAFHAGGRWEYSRYLKPGERVTAKPKMTGLRDVVGKRAGRMLIQEGETVYRTDDGEIVGRNLVRAFRIPRPDRGGLNYESKPPHAWTGEELEEMEAQILAYERRGSDPLYFEDVQIGDTLPERIKGPLDLATILAYYAGNFSAAYLSTDMAVRVRNLARTDPDKIPNNRPVELRTQRVEYGQGHQDPRVAAAVGMPGVYDNGWMRIGWIQQILSDWGGDHGFVKMIDSSLHLPNVIGDIVRYNGSVTGKSQDGGDHVVDVALEGLRQDGGLSIKATAQLTLPSRS